MSTTMFRLLDALSDLGCAPVVARLNDQVVSVRLSNNEADCLAALIETTLAERRAAA
jgi:hypothetical protein